MKDQKKINSENGNYNTGSILVIIVITILLTAWLLLPDKSMHQLGDNEHGHEGHGHEASEEEVAKGPHGSRLQAVKTSNWKSRFMKVDYHQSFVFMPTKTLVMMKGKL